MPLAIRLVMPCCPTTSFARSSRIAPWFLLGLLACEAGEPETNETEQAAFADVGIDDPNRVVPMVPFARPALGQRVTDPAFGTTIVRITDRAFPPEGFGTHIYSQLQA